MAATALEDLEQACGSIKELSFKAESRDEATEAFEAFRKSVTRVMRFADSSDCDLLASMEPKLQFAEFLLDLLARHTIYRSRVAEALRALQKSDSWAMAVQDDVELSVTIQRLVYEGDGAGKTLRARHLSSDDVKNANASAQLPHLLPGAYMGSSRRTASDPWSASSEMPQAWGVPPKSLVGTETVWSSWPEACGDNTSNSFKMNTPNSGPKRVLNWNAFVVAH